MSKKDMTSNITTNTCFLCLVYEFKHNLPLDIFIINIPKSPRLKYQIIEIFCFKQRLKNIPKSHSFENGKFQHNVKWPYNRF